jgi:GNAT superfamily N-acetyltransferase
MNDEHLAADSKQVSKPQSKRATAVDIPRMVTTLARAFDDDPLMLWMIPRSRRRVRLALFFALLLESRVALGETYSTPDRVGAAIWAPPDKWRNDFAQVPDSADRLISIFGANPTRAIDVLVALEEKHPINAPHWYLVLLGTHPDWQRTGVGSALVQPVLSRADSEGLPAYLEASKEINIAYYRSFGFEVTGEISIPNGGPRLWPMWREPRPIS